MHRHTVCTSMVLRRQVEGYFPGACTSYLILRPPSEDLATFVEIPNIIRYAIFASPTAESPWHDMTHVHTRAHARAHTCRAHMHSATYFMQSPIEGVVVGAVAKRPPPVSILMKYQPASRIRSVAHCIDSIAL